MTKEQIKLDRGQSYGTPESSFGRIAKLWSAYLDYQIEPHQIAIMMSLLKISRMVTATGEPLNDTYADSIIYIELAEELHKQEIEQNKKENL